ncbi:hypothetical protein [Winogradskyella sp. A3E31]|uniref:hypothetical protein n=1 Tax=Winogradskyella sp. A3E31 TaxID=3349637 RepID=UPI00398ACAE6
MNSTFQKHITSLLSFFGAITIYAQESVKKDSSNIEITRFKENISERYSGDEFNYSINDSGGVNLVQQVLRKFFGWLQDLFGFDIDYIDYQTLEYIIYGILGLGVLYLLAKFLIQNSISSVFKTETKKIDGFNYVEENIADINFDKLIKKALKANDYRLATRYLYLKSLKVLSQRNTIDWHYDKTNLDYINEIKNENVKTLFKRVSYIYDYVWYGEFFINQSDYDKNKKDFDHLISSNFNG